MAERAWAPLTPATLFAMVAVGLVGLLAAALIAAPPLAAPVWLVPVASAGLLAGTLAVLRWGRAAPLLALLALVPIFPVTTIGPLADALGGRGNILRTAFILLALWSLFVAYGAELRRPPRSLRRVIAGLLLLAGLGGVAAIANAADPAEAFSIAQQLVGQPLVFAALLVLVPAYLADEGEAARRRLLGAISVGVMAVATIAAVELLSGAAYDELRDITRAHGSVGADFLGALAVLGFFCGFAEWVRRPGDRTLQVLGALTVAAALLLLAGAVARGAVLGLLIGGIYVVASDPGYRRRALPIAAVIAALLAGSLLTPAGDLWKERLSARTIEAFDRPATWISGVRIGGDSVLTGVSENEIIRDIDDVRAYRQTPLGDTRVVPHNSWILAFAQGGIGVLIVLVATTLLLVAALRAPPGGRSREERVYVGGLLGLAAIAAVNNVLTHPELMIPALVLVSLVACRPARIAPEEAAGADHGPGRRYRRPLTSPGGRADG